MILVPYQKFPEVSLILYHRRTRQPVVFSTRAHHPSRSKLINPAQRNRGNVRMRGSARFLVESVARQIKPVNGLKRLMTVTTPQKHEKEINSGESILARDENVEPLVAFSRPPPIPPVLGPLVMLSLFQVSSRDDDNK